MNTKTVFVLLCLIVLFVTCSENQKKSNPNDPETNEHSVKTKNQDGTLFIDLSDLSTELTDLSEKIRDIKLVPLQTSPDCFIGNIRRIIENNRYIFIRDSKSQSIFRFDKNGKYISKIEKIGKGPGEYKRIRDFSLIPQTNELLILDFNFSRLLKYNYEGEFISKVPLNILPFGFVALSPELIACYHGRMTGFKMHDEPHQLYYYDFDGNLRSNYFPIKTTFSFAKYSQGFTNSNPIGSNLLINSFDYNIYEVKDTLAPKKIVQLDFGKYNVDTSYYLDPKEGQNRNKYFESTDKIKTLHNVVGNKSHISVGIPMEKERYILFLNRENNNTNILYRDSLRYCYTYSELLIPEPSGSFDNYFIAYYNTMDLIDQLDQMTEKKLSVLRKNIPGFEECEKLTDDDNPVLIYYAFK